MMSEIVIVQQVLHIDAGGKEQALAHMAGCGIDIAKGKRGAP